MKLIGHTPDGGTMYEFTPDEDRNLQALISAVAGDSFDLFQMNYRREPVAIMDDFAGVFGAIRAFALAKFKITELRQTIDQFESTLEQQD